MSVCIGLTQRQEAGVWIQCDPFHILCGISYLMAFLPCKSYQKLANNSIAATDTRASVSHHSDCSNCCEAPENGEISGKENKVHACLCLSTLRRNGGVREDGEITV